MVWCDMLHEWFLFTLTFTTQTKNLTLALTIHFNFEFRVFEIFGSSILGAQSSEDIEILVQSVFPDAMLKRVVSLDDYAKTLVVQEGVDNQI